MAYPGYVKPTGFETGPPLPPPPAPPGVTPPFSRQSGETTPNGCAQCDSEQSAARSNHASQGSYVAAKEAEKKSHYPNKS